MQMNREHLGEGYRVLLLPIPARAEVRAGWARPIKEYFEATSKARESYEALASRLDPELFADRP
jgi:hypothetical protein